MTDNVLEHVNRIQPESLSGGGVGVTLDQRIGVDTEILNLRHYKQADVSQDFTSQ
jgi:hypothetical protein